MRRFVLAFLLAATIPAAAEDPGPATRCRDLLASLGLHDPASVTPAGPACDVEGAMTGIGAAQFRIDRLILIGASTPEGGPPAQLHAEAHGIRSAAPGAPAFIQFLRRAQTRPVSVLLDYSRGADGTLRIERADLVSPATGVQSLAAVIEATPWPPGASWASARLRSLRLHLDGRGAFELFVPLLAPLLLADDPDPAATFKAKKAQAAEAAQHLGAGVASPSSVEALTRFLGALPHPDQPFDFRLELPDPISLDTFADPARLAAALSPGSITAAYGD